MSSTDVSATDSNNSPAPQGWMNDVQRALALILIGSFAFVTVFSTVCAVFWPQDAALTDMAKSLQSNLTNMCLIGLGFFFGNTMAKMAQDAGQQKVVDKLTSAGSSNGGPVAPVPAPVTPWWGKLTAGEQAALTALAQGLGGATPDARAAAIQAAMMAGAANADDLNYLVTKEILTADRPAVIAAP